MKSNPILVMLFAVAMIQISDAQVFNRSELTTQVNTPWEITFGPDNYLWLTESGGRVIRVDPVTGNKQIVYTAPDYFNGSPLEQWPLCFQPNIGAGTLGLALHPDFPMHQIPLFILFIPTIMVLHSRLRQSLR
ncbi:MAG: hypothetical protein IPG39_08325 [Bacteroidetes bacterium]|nr:hypothetical protein [Bacteroidota bacterium]